MTRTTVWLLACFALFLGMGARPAAALHEWEVWRSPFGAANGVALNPSDGSVWASIGDSVYHYDAAHNLLSRTELWVPESVGVDPADGSCWVADWQARDWDANPSVVIHLAADGTEMVRAAGFRAPEVATVTGPDGSLWVEDGGGGYRISSAGQILAHVVSVRLLGADPGDGTCWALDANDKLVHLSLTGAVLWRSALALVTPGITGAVDGGNHSVWLTLGDHLRHLSQAGTELSFTTFGESVDRACANPADGTCWAATASALIHVGSDGSVLGSVPHPGGEVWAVEASTGRFWGGSLWQAEADGTELWRTGGGFIFLDVYDPGSWYWALDATGDLVRYSSSHEELVRHPPVGPVYAQGAENSADGSLYIVRGGTLQRIAPDGSDTIVPLPVAAKGAVVNGTDGSFWSWVDGILPGEYLIVHFAADGSQLASILVPYGTSVAVSPGDGSVWTTWFTGKVYRLTHFAVDGTELSHHDGPGGPSAVDNEDGSCWVAGPEGRLWHFAWEGTLLQKIYEATGPFSSVAVDQHTGCCWVSQFTSVSVYDRFGTYLWQTGGFDGIGYFVVDPRDGSVWMDCGMHLQIVHLWAPTTRFFDVLPGDWEARAVRMCWEYGIVGGYPDGNYHPDWVVTRAQMAGFIARALAGGGDVPPGPATPHFPDVGTDYWAYKYIEYAYANNIVAGYPGGQYVPEAPVDRGQMAAFIARAIVTPHGEEGLASYTPPETPTFPDVPTDFWTYKHIEYIKSQGIVGGYPDGWYHPGDPCTRDQMAVFVARAFDLLPY